MEKYWVFRKKGLDSTQLIVRVKRIRFAGALKNKQPPNNLKRYFLNDNSLETKEKYIQIFL